MSAARELALHCAFKWRLVEPILPAEERTLAQYSEVLVGADDAKAPSAIAVAESHSPFGGRLSRHCARDRHCPIACAAVSNTERHTDRLADVRGRVAATGMATTNHIRPIIPPIESRPRILRFGSGLDRSEGLMCGFFQD